MSIRFSSSLLLSLLAAACSADHEAPTRESVQAPVVSARRAALPSFHSVAGTVRAQTSSTLAANVIGTVIRVSVAEGDRVRAGDLLVEIEAREPRAMTERARAGREELERAIEAAAANARLAETTHRRFAALRERGSASQHEYDEALARHTVAQAELARLSASRAGADAALNQAAAVLELRSLRAPMSGVVTARFIDPGAQAAPGIPLIAIDDEGATRVDATLPAGIAVAVGTRALVTADGNELKARVVRLQPSIDPISRSALVKLEVDRPLRAGAFVTVAFPVGERSGVVIPATAVVRRGQLASVFAVDGGHVARMRLVTLGAANGDDVEILSGLDAGEVVVATPARVREGVIVRSGA